MNATQIPVGARLTRAYWTVPAHYAISPAYTSQADALVAAIAQRRTEVEASRERYGDTYHHPETVWVMLRWYLDYSDIAGKGGGLDLEAERFEYDTLADADAALARLQKNGGSCRVCGGRWGAHNVVHTRHENGGGSNRPCPNAGPQGEGRA